jgi:hypothetical protein
LDETLIEYDGREGPGEAEGEGEGVGEGKGDGEGEGEALGDGDGELAGVLGGTAAVTEGTVAVGAAEGVGVADEHADRVINKDGIRIKILIINGKSNFLFFI